MAIKTSFKPADALKEYLLSGGEISLIESQIVFGVQSLNAELGRPRRLASLSNTDVFQWLKPSEG